MSSIKIDKRFPYSHTNAIMRITEWKQKIIETLCMDDDIAKLLYYNTPDALSRPALTEDQKYDLYHKNIFGYQYNPDTVEQQKSFITLGISGFIPQESWRQFSQRYVMGYLYFNILCDIKIMDTDDGERRDLLLARIYDLFQDSDEYGMGHIQEGNLTELWQQNNKFGGYTLMMRVIDLK